MLLQSLLSRPTLDYFPRVRAPNHVRGAVTTAIEL
jgi:hypothetical protein